MAGISIGRFGLNPVAGEVHVASAQLDGDRLTISGDTMRVALDGDPLTLIKLRAACQQIDGMAAGGEWAVPLVWSESPQLDGWWRVISARHSLNYGAIQADMLAWDFELQRVPGWRLPWLEHRAQLVALPNDHGFVPVTNFAGPALGAPGNYGGQFELTPHPAVNGPTGIAAADGPVVLWRAEWASTAETVKRVDYRFSSSPSGAYAGGCQIEGYYGDATSDSITGSEAEWFPLVGRQAPVPYLRLSNGLVRVRPQAWATGSGGRVAVEWWDGSQWQLYRYEFGSAGATSWDSADTTGFGPELKSVHVLRNTPESSTIRAIWMVQGKGSTNVDFTLRRGGRTVSIVMSEPAGTARQWMIQPVTAVAFTATTAGQLTETTAWGTRKQVIMSPTTSTRNVATGQVFHTSAAAQGRFGLGCEIASGAAWWQASAQAVDHYFSQPGLRMISAGR